MVIVDIPASARVLLQAIGRLFRIYQIHPVMCWILTLDNTYDEKLLSTVCKKYLRIIAGQGAITVKEKEIDELHERLQEMDVENRPVSFP